MNIKSSVKLNKQNQIIVPKVVRDALGVEPNGYLDFEIHGKRVTIGKGEVSVWDQVEKKKRKYHIDGKIGNPEIDWGENVGSEVIDE